MITLSTESVINHLLYLLCMLHSNCIQLLHPCLHGSNIIRHNLQIRNHLLLKLFSPRMNFMYKLLH